MTLSPAFVCIASFLISFLIVRTSARLTRSVSWWPGGVQTDSGVHLHHLVWGIVLLLGSGFIAFATEAQAPYLQILAGFFGVGMGLTLDEFALWIHLEDVYWADQGRSSLDAVILATSIGALVLAGLQPLGIDDEGSVILIVGTVAVHLAVSYVCFAKSRLLFGTVAVFFFPAGLIAAVRLAKPGSPWARARYDEEKSRRCAERFGPHARQVRLTRQIHDLIGGVLGAEQEEPPPVAPAPPGPPEPERERIPAGRS